MSVPIDRLAICGVLPVVELRSLEMAVPLAIALRDAGLPCIEITFRTIHAAAAIERIRISVPEVLVAAGTVLNVADADAALSAGAQLIVAPGSNRRVIDFVRGRDVPMVPGIVTPTEIEDNLERGVQLMKFFPAEATGGVAYLRALAAPFPAVRFMPTGGIRPATLASYLALPSVVACGGTWIAPPDVVDAGDMETVARLAREAVGIVVGSRDGTAQPRAARSTTVAAGSADA